MNQDPETGVHRLLRRLTLVAVLALVGCNSLAEASPPAKRPKLVLQITVDQLRGDSMTRFGDRFADC